MAEFKLTEKDWKAHPHLEFRQSLVCDIVAWTIDGKVPQSLLDLVQLAEDNLGQLGYSGPEADLAKYAETRFGLEDERIVAPLWPSDEEEIEDEDEEQGSHPFPSRTRKLSPPGPMVLRW